jgi:SSS family solute:Na+ symporter
MPQLVITEWLMVAVFLAGVVAWGIRMRRRAAASMSASFLAGRSVPGFIASLSTVATNLNINDFIGTAGAVYAVGIVMVHGPLLNGAVILFLALVLVRKLRSCNVYTLGEWLGERYAPPVGHAYSIVWSLVWMVFNLGLYLYGGGLILHTLLGWPLYPSIVALSFVAALYTLLGGFGAVVATDVLQVVLMFIPFLVIAPSALIAVGGPAGIVRALPAAHVGVWTNNSPFGTLGVMFFGALFMSLSYWGSEAQIIQRPLSARSSDDASVAYIGAGFWFAVLVPLLIIIPGLAAKALFPDLPRNDEAVPMLIKTFLPSGLYGLTIVGLMAGFLSSADSQINAFCTMFTTDVYARLIRRGREEAHYLKVSKIAGVAFTLAAIATAVLISHAPNGMFLYAIGILAVIMPPFAAVTIVGVLWKKASGVGAIAGLVAGGGCAIVLFVLSSYTQVLSGIAADTLFFRAMTAYAVTTAFTLLGSFVRPRKPTDDDGEARPETGVSPKVKALALGLLSAVVGMYVVFTLVF